MNPPPDTPDPFLKSLTDEASELPALAASEARRFSARRARHHHRLIRGLAIAMVGVCCWQTLPLLWRGRSKAGSPPIFVHQPSSPKSAPKATRPAEFVKVQTMEESISQPLPAPSGASQEQKDLLEAARGLPLVLVMDNSGKLARIHVVERSVLSKLER